MCILHFSVAQEAWCGVHHSNQHQLKSIAGWDGCSKRCIHPVPQSISTDVGGCHTTTMAAEVEQKNDKNTLCAEKCLRLQQLHPLSNLPSLNSALSGREPQLPHICASNAFSAKGTQSKHLYQRVPFITPKSPDSGNNPVGMLGRF